MKVRRARNFIVQWVLMLIVAITRSNLHVVCTVRVWLYMFWYKYMYAYYVTVKPHLTTCLGVVVNYDISTQHKHRGGRTSVISHMAMECVATMFTLGSWPLTFPSIAMVPVVDLLLCSLASSHYFLVISNIVSCYGRRQLTWVNPPRLLSIVA